MVTSPTIPNATTTKGRVLIIGATGFIGRFVAEASLLTAHPTYLLLRPPPLVPSKDAIVKTFQEKGAIVIHVIHFIFSFYYLMLYHRGNNVYVYDRPYLSDLQLFFINKYLF